MLGGGGGGGVRKRVISLFIFYRVNVFFAHLCYLLSMHDRIQTLQREFATV